MDLWPRPRPSRRRADGSAHGLGGALSDPKRRLRPRLWPLAARRAVLTGPWHGGGLQRGASAEARRARDESPLAGGGGGDGHAAAAAAPVAPRPRHLPLLPPARIDEASRAAAKATRRRAVPTQHHGVLSRDRRRPRCASCFVHWHSRYHRQRRLLAHLSERYFLALCGVGNCER